MAKGGKFSWHSYLDNLLTVEKERYRRVGHIQHTAVFQLLKTLPELSLSDMYLLDNLSPYTAARMMLVKVWTVICIYDLDR